MTASGHSKWKCVNYNYSKCPAYVITKNDKVIQKLVWRFHVFLIIKIIHLSKLLLIRDLSRFPFQNTRYFGEIANVWSPMTRNIVSKMTVAINPV